MICEKRKAGYISVIIPIYNKAMFLENCIKSVIKSSYPELEIILIDDGSTDNSLDLCNQYKEKDSRICVFSKQNGGVSSARNYGLEKSTGEYIAFVDPDDSVDETLFFELKNAIEQYNADISYADDIYKDGMYNNRDKYVVLNAKKYNWMEKTAHFTVWGVLYRSRIIKDMQFSTNLTIGEDTLFFAECVNKSEKIVVVDRYLYNYYKNDLSVTSGKWNSKKMDELLARELMCKEFINNKFVKNTAEMAEAMCAKSIVVKYCKDEVFLDKDIYFCKKIFRKYARKVFLYQLRTKQYVEAFKTICTLIAWKNYVNYQMNKYEEIN